MAVAKAAITTAIPAQNGLLQGRLAEYFAVRVIPPSNGWTLS